MKTKTIQIDIKNAMLGFTGFRKKMVYEALGANIPHGREPGRHP